MTDDEAAGRAAQAAAISQAMAHQGRVGAQAPGAAQRGVPAPLWILVGLSAAAAVAWMLVS